MSTKSETFWREGLRLISYCPLCQSEFRPVESKLLGERGEKHLVHVRCGKCRNALLALVLVSKAGVSSVGLLTDLTHDDVIKFQQSLSVSLDDVLAVHQGLIDGTLLTQLTSSG